MVGKKISTLLAVALSISLLGGCAKTEVVASSTLGKSSKVVKIGISQIAEHPALDSARKGFIDALKSKGFEDGKNVKTDFQNAQGDIATAQTIAQNFVSQKEDLILAIATPAAQAAYNSTKDIPILITAVTDPVKAGIVKSLDKPGTNVSGTSDNISVDKQFELLKKLVPNAKNVGVLYNSSESNSEVQLENIKKALPSFNMEMTAVGVTSVNEIPQALSSMFGKIDVLYVPTDNLIASAISLISNECFKKKVPVIGSEKGQVESGALATNGIDYYKLGFQTGLMAVDVINGKKVSDIPVTTLSELQLVINTDAAKKLGIQVPEDILSKAEKITGGVK